MEVIIALGIIAAAVVIFTSYAVKAYKQFHRTMEHLDMQIAQVGHSVQQLIVESRGLVMQGHNTLHSIDIVVADGKEIAEAIKFTATPAFIAKGLLGKVLGR